MFSSLTLHGTVGAVLWGYREAVQLSSWRIAKDAKTGRWLLKGTAAKVDAYAVRQGPLLFTAPKEGGVPWAWGIESLEVGRGAVLAHLGPPER